MTNTPSWLKPVKLPTDQDFDRPSWLKPVNLPTDQKPEEEGGLKSAARYGMQIAKAAPLAIPGVARGNFALSLMTGGKLNEEEIPEEYQRPPLGQVGEVQESPINQQKPPSEQFGNPLGDLYQHIEKETGLPLSAKTQGQKTVGIASDAVAMAPGSLPYRSLIGIEAASIYSAAKEMGIPDDVAANLATVASQITARTGLEKEAARLLEGKKTSPSQKNSTPQAQKTITGPKDIEVTGTDVTSKQTNKSKLPPSPPVTESQVEFPEGFEGVPSAKIGQMVKQRIPEATPPSMKLITPSSPELPPEVQSPQLPKTPEFQPPELSKIPEFQSLQPLPPKPEKKLPPVVQEATFDSSHEPVTLNGTIGNMFSTHPVKSPTEGGSMVVKSIDQGTNKLWKEVNDNYDIAKYLYKGKKSIYPKLIESLVKDIESLSERSMASLANSERKLLRRSKGILSNIAILAPEDYKGFTVQGYVPRQYAVSNLINTRKSNNDDINFDWEQGDKSGRLKPLSEALELAIESAGGTKEALAAYKKANDFYRTRWAEVYLNDKIAPYRDNSKNENTTKLFNNATKDIDTYLALKKALTSQENKDGPVVLSIIKRHLVQDRLQRIIEKPENVNSIDYNNLMSELDPILTPQEKSNIDEIFKNIVAQRSAEVARVARETEYAKQEIERQKQVEIEYGQKVKERNAIETSQNKQIADVNRARNKQIAEANRARKEQLKEHNRIVSAMQTETQKKQKDYKNEILKRQKDYEDEIVNRQKLLEKRAKNWKAGNAQIEKIRNMSDVEVSNYMDSEEGLKTVGAIMTKSKRGLRDFEIVGRAKGAQMLFSGKGHADPEDILKIIDNIDKRRYLELCIGGREVARIQKEAKLALKIRELLKLRHLKESEFTMPINWKENLKDPEAVLKFAKGLLTKEGFAKTISKILKTNFNNSDVLEALKSIDEELMKASKSK